MTGHDDPRPFQPQNRHSHNTVYVDRAGCGAPYATMADDRQGCINNKKRFMTNRASP